MIASRTFILVIGLAAVFTAGLLPAEADYRLTFKNGTSIEVPTYEDLGDALRYPRFGGMVTVPKANVASVEEAFHYPAPEKPSSPGSAQPAPIPQTASKPVAPASAASSAGANFQLPSVQLPQVQVPAIPFQWKRAGHGPVTVGTIWVLGAAAFIVAVIATVLYFVSNSGEDLRREGRARGAEGGKMLTEGMKAPARPLGVVLVIIYDLVLGGNMLSLGILGVAIGQLLGDVPLFLIPAEGPIVVIFLSLVAVAFGAVMLACAYGMWSFQAWGRSLQAVICFIDIPLEAVSLLAAEPSAASLIGIAALFLDAAILIYISRPRLQALYVNNGLSVDDAPAADEERFTPSL